ncbi:MAG: hypothetical protein ACT4RN_06070 [Pseudonocardia sp.]
MAEPVWGQGVLTRVDEIEDRWGPRVGRHSADDEATLTPIFHALARAGWGRRAEPARGRSAAPAPPAPAPATPAPAANPVPADPVVAFHRDPLLAPLPGTVADAASSAATSGRRRAGAHAVTDGRRGGRHHRRLVPLDGGGASEA